MKNLPLNALRAFAVVFAHGGVRAAARELGIAHSSVSRHLAELESFLGTPLTRGASGRRGLLFTAHGESLGKATLANLRELEQAVGSLRESRGRRSVTLSVPPSFAMRWLLPRLAAWEQRDSGIELSVVVDNRRRSVAGNEADLGIWMGDNPTPGVHREPLMTEELYPVMSPGYWARSGRPETPQDLVGLRLLHDRDPRASWEHWRQHAGPPTLDAHSGPRLSSTDLVLGAAEQGLGVALARHRLAQAALSSGSLLRPISRENLPIGWDYWIVRPKNLGIRDETAEVIAWLHQEAETEG